MARPHRSAHGPRFAAPHQPKKCSPPSRQGRQVRKSSIHSFLGALCVLAFQILPLLFHPQSTIGIQQSSIQSPPSKHLLRATHAPTPRYPRTAPRYPRTCSRQPRTCSLLGSHLLRVTLEIIFRYSLFSVTCANFTWFLADSLLGIPGFGKLRPNL